jgi:hypothetical protein
MAALRDDEGAGDAAVQRRQDSLVGLRELREVPVGLSWSSDPLREVRNIAVIRNKSATHSAAIFQLEQKLAAGEWWAWVDLNYRPRPYQGRALAT